MHANYRESFLCMLTTVGRSEKRRDEKQKKRKKNTEKEMNEGDLQADYLEWYAWCVCVCVCVCVKGRSVEWWKK